MTSGSPLPYTLPEYIPYLLASADCGLFISDDLHPDFRVDV